MLFQKIKAIFIAIRDLEVDFQLSEFSAKEIDALLNMQLGPLLYFLANRHTQEKLNESMDKLASAAIYAKFTTQQNLGVVVSLASYCQKQQITMTLLKGISTSTELYPEPHLRVMGDIDLLFKERDFILVDNYLKDNGFIQKSLYSDEFYKNLHHDMPYYHAKKDCWIEIHHHLFSPQSKFSNEPIFLMADDNRCLSQIIGVDVYRFRVELQLIYTVIHWSESSNCISGRMAILDVILLCSKYKQEIDWQWIAHRLSNSLCAQPMFILLSFLSRNGLVLGVEQELYKWRNYPIKQNSISLYIAHKVITKWFFEDIDLKAKFLTVNNLELIWRTLLTNQLAVVKVFLLLWNIGFPPDNPRKFNLRFQWRRLKVMLGRSVE
ncbi:MAG: nucleotidyltransferase family protein [Gammaproteobacteria bacterium]|nr:nucleotidyltransferase family protein [Gammaproteobacteria bacterium]MDH5730317.1 nucleotidyltransferase family protein [Gammaproteobacteria bacterium]